MIRQFGLPSLFITLSAAESKWPELLRILAMNIDGVEISSEEANGLSFGEKAKLIRADPVTCALYFWHSFKELFKTWKSKSGPFGTHEIEHHYFRIEFQHRGSPHVHMLLWLKGAPIFNPEVQSSFEELTSFIDSLITCSSKVSETSKELVSLQRHKHTYTCRRKSKNNEVCRFGIPFYPMDCTRVLLPLEGKEALVDRKSMLETIKEKINSLYSDEKHEIQFGDFLKTLKISKANYLLCIRSTLKKPKIFLKRDLDEIYVNNYNYKILNLHRANMDIQFVLDAYACASYIVDYINKSDRGMSKLLKETLVEAQKGNTTIRKQLRTVANKFINVSEISAQEAAWHLLRLRMSEASEAEIFIPTGRPEDRVRMIKNEEQLRKMNPESTDVCVPGVIEHYIVRPTVLEDMCLAKFAAQYNFFKFCKQAKDPSFSDDEGQLDEEEVHADKKECILPLKDKSGFIKLRKKSKVIRYRKYSEKLDPENFFREMLMLYSAWRNEPSELLNIDIIETFNEKKDIIMKNRKYFVRNINDESEFQDAVEFREKEISKEIESEDENDATPDEEFAEYECNSPMHQFDIMNELGEIAPENYSEKFSIPQQIPESEYLEILQNLNSKQKDYLMHVMNEIKRGEKGIRHFISGSAGTGKTLLIKILYQTLIRHYNKGRGSDPSQVKVLLCAPTGKAAFNIEGMTLHSAFALPVNQVGNKMSDLSAEISNTLSVKFCEVKAVIIDEISMMGSQMLSNVNRRLQDIFRCNEHFGGISIFAFGDFRQLPPVGDSFVFLPSRSDVLGQIVGPPSILWEKFQIYELTQIMRQRDDLSFAKALSNLSEGKMTQVDVDLISSRIFKEETLPEIAQKSIRVFLTNSEKDYYNEKILNKMESEGTIAEAYDCILGHGSESMKKKILEIAAKKRVTETYGLPKSVLLKIGARYMLTNNIDISDGLVNGSTGRLRKIQYGTLYKNKSLTPIRMWIEFDSERVGVNARAKYRSYRTRKMLPENWTPIELVKRVIHSRKSSANQVLRRQFPVIAAEGMTIHKSQGSTYNEIVVMLNKNMTRQSLYVALSRTTKASGLYLIGKFVPPSPVSKSDVVATEMERLRQNPIIPKLEFIHEQ